MGRGRPRGTGYDDRDRIEAVRRSMRSGISRRAAILDLFGPDQLRRIEMKMRIATMAENANTKIEAIIRATAKGMGLTDEQAAALRILPVGDYSIRDLATMSERAREQGFGLVYRITDPVTGSS